MRNIRLALAFLACIFTAYGQVSTGSIRGTVSDPSGAVVPDAVIVLTNIRTGVVQSVKSDNSGNYLIDFVPTGEYKITAEMTGFKKFVQDNITLDMSRQLRVDIAIQPGLVTETISVTAATSLVETETGVLSTTVENQQVTSLPLLGRDPAGVPAGCAGRRERSQWTGDARRPGSQRSLLYRWRQLQFPRLVGQSGKPESGRDSGVQDSHQQLFGRVRRSQRGGDDVHHQIGHQSAFTGRLSSFFATTNSMRETSSAMRAPWCGATSSGAP